MEIKSKIEKIKDIDYNQEIVVTKLFSDPQAIKVHEQRLKELLKDADDNEIALRIKALILKENAFSYIMQYLTKLFKFKILLSEQKDVANKYALMYHKEFSALTKQEQEDVLEIANKIIIKKLVFIEIAKENNITVTDEDCKLHLEAYQKSTNQPIEDLMNNEEKFNEVKEIILDEKIFNFLLSSFKVDFSKVIDTNTQQEKKEEPKNS